MDAHIYTTSCTPPKLAQEALLAKNEALPNKSRKRYQFKYESFLKWLEKSTAANISENILLAYFHQLSKKQCPTTLWSTYSMLRTMIKFHNNEDIGKHANLIGFLKSNSKGYVAEKADIFTDEQVFFCLKNAPDDSYSYRFQIFAFFFSFLILC